MYIHKHVSIKRIECNHGFQGEGKGQYNFTFLCLRQQKSTKRTNGVFFFQGNSFEIELHTTVTVSGGGGAIDKI